MDWCIDLIAVWKFDCKDTMSYSEKTSILRAWDVDVIEQEKPMPESLFYQSFRPEACNFIKKETLAQVFSCEFSKY